MYGFSLASGREIGYLLSIAIRRGVMLNAPTESLGPKLRRRRRRLGFTLDELAVKTGISKPYLSLIETERVANPPSDEKLKRLEQTLDFAPGELLTQAHLQRTPKDVRDMLTQLLLPSKLTREGKTALGKLPADLDTAFLSGMLQEFVDRSAGNVERIVIRPVPLINKVAAGYPTDFTDLAYPPRAADEYTPAPGMDDPDVFACRVHGDSMMPKYHPGDVVIFSPASAVKSGDDCFVRFDDGKTTFKRVHFETTSEGADQIRLQPLNNAYHPQVVPAEQVGGVYKAVYQVKCLET